MADQVEKDRVFKLIEMESDKEPSKLATDAKLEKLKYSFEMKHQKLLNQL